MQEAHQGGGDELDRLRVALLQEGAAMAALEAGLSQVQVQDLGRWASLAMVIRYVGADPAVWEALADVIKI
jgi:hypothetical protein